jgi:hypothetical protein
MDENNDIVKLTIIQKNKFMKKTLLILFAVFQLTICKAQEFASQLKFIDAVGNKDSVNLGYDQAATDTLDPVFGEINIISLPYSSELNVRAGNEFMKYSFSSQFGQQTTFETKTQIVPNVCGFGSSGFWTAFPIIELNVVSDHFPIKAIWNKLLFNDTCRNGSIITSVHPGGWWDTYGFRTLLGSKDSIMFNRSQYKYFNSTDTVYVYWVAFVNLDIMLSWEILGMNDYSAHNNSIHIVPNPASQYLSVNLIKSFEDKYTIRIYDSFGQHVLSSDKLEDINVSGLKCGIYYISVTSDNGSIYNSKFLKL